MADVVAVDVLAGLRAALDVLVESDPGLFADGALLVGLVREAARLDAVVCERLAAFEVSGGWGVDGAANAVAWVCTRARTERRVTRRRVRVGCHLRCMDRVRAAFVAGEIGVEHVEVLVAARGRSRASAVAFGRDELLLVGWALSLKFHQFRHVVGEWLARVDEDGAEAHAEHQRDGRRLHVSQSLDGVWFADGVLDPVSGEIVSRVLSGIERELFEVEWAATSQRLGREPSVSELGRTGAQRRVDALVEMATRAATVPKDGRRPVPLFTVLVGAEVFARTCALVSGSLVTSGVLARWASDAVFERVVFDGPDRVLSVSYQRGFVGAVRRAVEVRDRGCAHPFCDVDAERCEVDHVRPWSAGGETSVDNGRLLCGFHNRLRATRPATPHERTDPVFDGDANPCGESTAHEKTDPVFQRGAANGAAA